MILDGTVNLGLVSGEQLPLSSLSEVVSPDALESNVPEESEESDE